MTNPSPTGGKKVILLGLFKGSRKEIYISVCFVSVFFLFWLFLTDRTVPLTMTAEAVRRRSKFPRDDSVIKIELFYTNEEQQKCLAAAKRNEDCQADIDMAWRLLEENKVDLNLMLTSWAKRHRDRNRQVHMVPSVAFAESYVNGDEDFCGTAELGVRARYHIHNGKCSRGERLFED